jgi:hypothetical protein
MQQEQPVSIMQQALGEQWHQLDPVVQQHYCIAPGTSSDITTLTNQTILSTTEQPGLLNVAESVSEKGKSTSAPCLLDRLWVFGKLLTKYGLSALCNMI